MIYLPRLRRIAGLSDIPRRDEPEIAFQAVEMRFIDLPEKDAKDVVRALEILSGETNGLALGRWHEILSLDGFADPDETIRLSCAVCRNMVYDAPDGTKMVRPIWQVNAAMEELSKGQSARSGWIMQTIAIAQRMKEFSLSELTLELHLKTGFSMKDAAEVTSHVIDAFPGTFRPTASKRYLYVAEPQPTRASNIEDIRRWATLSPK